MLMDDVWTLGGGKVEELWYALQYLTLMIPFIDFQICSECTASTRGNDDPINYMKVLFLMQPCSLVSADACEEMASSGKHTKLPNIAWRFD
jgi:hypothetical protein